MAQIQSGTASVTQGDGTVIASDPNDWSDAKVGDLFAVDDVVYFIGADATLVGGIWQLELTTGYLATDEPEAIYTIHRDFEPLFGFPIFAPGDTQTTSIINRITNMVAAAILAGGGGGGSGAGWHQKTISGADIGATTIQMTFPGAPLGTIPHAVGRPVFIKSNPSENNIDAISIDSITVNSYNVNLSGPAVSGQILSNIYVP